MVIVNETIIIFAIMKGIGLIAVLLTMSLGVFAQADTSGRGGYIHIFDNLTTPGVPLPDDYNGKLHLTDSGDSTEVSIDEAVQNIKILYDAGRFSEALRYAYYVRTRQNDEKDKFSRLQTEQLRKYSIASFAEVGYNRMADSLMELFCNRIPFYKIKVDDPDAFVKLKAKYDTRPLIAFRVSASHVYPVMKIDTIYTIRERSSGYHYTDIKSMSQEFSMIFYPWKKWEVAVGVSLTKLRFNRLESGAKLYFLYAEEDKFYSFPLEVGYNLPSIYGIITPEVYLGVKYTTIYKSDYKTRDLRRTNVWELGIADDTVSCAGSIMGSRNSFVTLYGGARANYSFRRFVFFVGVHYGMALKEMRKPENKYMTTDLIVNHKFIPEAMRLHQIAVNFGLKINLVYKTSALYGYGYKK